MSWIQSPFSAGRTCNSYSNGGIPSGKTLWGIPRVGKYGLDSDLCAVDGKIIISSAARHIKVVDAVDGKIIWEKEFQDGLGYGVSVAEKYLGIGWKVVELATGKECADFRRLVGEENIGKYGGLVSVGGGFVRSIQGTVVDNFLLHVGDTNVCKGFFLGSHLEMIAGDLNSQLLFGWKNCELACFDIGMKEEVWTLEVPLSKDNRPMTAAGFAIANSCVYLHLNFDTLWCIDAKTGVILWKRGPDSVEKNATPYELSPPNMMAVCEDRLYLQNQMSRNGLFKCYSAHDGSLLWEKHVDDMQSSCIAGDLIFGIKNQDQLVAWDRYTGEEVWQAEKKMGAAYHVIADGDKVIYSSTTGELRCYQWNKIYVSPFLSRL